PPEAMNSLETSSADPADANVVTLTAPINAPHLPKNLDAVFIRQNYHDLYDKFVAPADVPAFHQAVFGALNPSGVSLRHALADAGVHPAAVLHPKVFLDVLHAGDLLGDVFRTALVVAAVHRPDERHFALAALDLDLRGVEPGIVAEPVVHVLADAVVRASVVL